MEGGAVSGIREQLVAVARRLGVPSAVVEYAWDINAAPVRVSAKHRRILRRASKSKRYTSLWFSLAIRHYYSRARIEKMFYQESAFLRLLPKVTRFPGFRQVCP